MARATSQSVADDIGKLLLRVTLGGLILLHGISKLSSGVGSILEAVAKTGMPSQLGYLVYVGEILAPVLLIVGLWTRPAALVVAINMVVAVALVHEKQIFTLSHSGGWALELQGMYLIAALAVALLGAGRISAGGASGRWN